jgi:hypothetical protein
MLMLRISLLSSEGIELRSMLWCVACLLQERSDLESAAAARLDAAQAQAAAEAQALRCKLEGRIGAIAARLGQLASQEESRERRRQELAAQVGQGFGSSAGLEGGGAH